MSRRTTVARLKRDTLRNTTQRKCGPHKRLGLASRGTTHHARGTAQRNHQKELGQGQCTERNRDRTDVQEETSATMEMQ
jgi:hypothetical protein